MQGLVDEWAFYGQELVWIRKKRTRDPPWSTQRNAAQGGAHRRRNVPTQPSGVRKGTNVQEVTRCGPIVKPQSQRKRCSATWRIGWPCRASVGCVKLQSTSLASSGTESKHWQTYFRGSRKPSPWRKTTTSWPDWTRRNTPDGWKRESKRREAQQWHLASSGWTGDLCKQENCTAKLLRVLVTPRLWDLAQDDQEVLGLLKKWRPHECRHCHVWYLLRSFIFCTDHTSQEIRHCKTCSPRAYSPPAITSTIWSTRTEARVDSMHAFKVQETTGTAGTSCESIPRAVL